MKIAVTALFLLMSLSWTNSIQSSVGVVGFANFLNVGYKTALSLKEQSTVSAEGAFDIRSFGDAFLNLGYLHKDLYFNLKGDVKYIGSKNIPFEVSTGFQYSLNDYAMTLGVRYQDKSILPYLLFSTQWGSFTPYINFSDKIQLGLYYGFDLEEDKFNEYFKIISPRPNSNLNAKEVVIKGYFLDTGKIFMNNELLALRNDGMFIKKVQLSKFGRNEFFFSMKGENLENYEYTLVLNRSSSFSDISKAQQVRWASVFDRIPYIDGDTFKPDKEIDKTEFYLQLAKFVGLKKYKYNFSKYFTDVQNEELRTYLYSYYGRGYFKTAYKKFYPYRAIKRQEALTVLSRFLEDMDEYVPFTFKDLPSKHWLYDSVNKLKNYGITHEYEIRPQDNLTRAEFFDYLAGLSSFFADKSTDQSSSVSASDDSVDVSPIIPQNVEINQDEFDFADITLLNPVKDTRSGETPFFVKGFGPPGLVVTINHQSFIINSRGRFAEAMDLEPGLNNLVVQVNDQKRNFIILYLKKFDDLSANEYFTELIEKIATLGYIDPGSSFGPSEYVTREELMSVFVKLGKVSPTKFARMKDKEKEVTYEEALSLVNKGFNLDVNFDASNEDILTRKVFALLIYEIPEVREHVKNFYSKKKKKLEITKDQNSNQDSSLTGEV